MSRETEIAANLRHVRARIDAACAIAGRSPSEITLIAVTKTFPSSDVEILAGLGIGDIGENLDQEAVEKVAELTTRWGEPAQRRLRWHFVGALQTNKAGSAVRYASMVHSVDRLRLVHSLHRAVSRRPSFLPALRCLVQVDLDEVRRPERSGAAPGDVSAIADAIAASSGLELAGVMAVAPLRADPVAAFARLAEVASRLRHDHPGATAISAGMSADLEAAIQTGATHLRVGAALLGSRPKPG